jgi:hypothetical protein
MNELRERIAQAIMAGDLLAETHARREPDYCGVDARIEAVMSVITPLLATCSCGSTYETYEGPEPDCPVHGAVRALNEATREIDRLRREVEFEAHGVGWTGIEYAIFAEPVCACVTDEQAATLGPGFSRPVCAVHPSDAGSS